MKVLGTISDAQESELLALEQLWSDVPHKVCQFHVLRDAIGPAYEADRKVKTAMRKQLQPKLKALRKQLKQKPAQTTAGEAEQLVVLDDYALGAVSSLKRDGLIPFDFAAVQADEELGDVAQSLEHLAQKGEL